MNNGANIKMLLRPMGVYKLENSYLGAELDCVGAALDQVEEELERIQREMCLLTARHEGLELVAHLFAPRPAARQPEQLARALTALTRIGADSFTCQALNSTLAGCGLNVQVRETGMVNTVEVSFPDVPGIPEEFEHIREVLEGILPAHLLVQYIFWYQTWRELEEKQLTWRGAQQGELCWDDLEKMGEE